MAKVIVATMSEWHQVQRKYALEIDLAYLKDIFPDKSDSKIYFQTNLTKTFKKCLMILYQGIYLLMT